MRQHCATSDSKASTNNVREEPEQERIKCKTLIEFNLTSCRLIPFYVYKLKRYFQGLNLSLYFKQGDLKQIQQIKIWNIE